MEQSQCNITTEQLPSRYGFEDRHIAIENTTAYYEDRVTTMKWKQNDRDTTIVVASHCSHFSSLLAAGEIWRGGTSATQRQKFHTDDVKSVRNPVRSADWSTEQLHCFSYCLRMTDKRQRATKIKCKHAQYLWNIFFSKGSIWVFLELVHRWTQLSRVRNCAFLVANAPKNSVLATRISWLVASWRLVGLVVIVDFHVRRKWLRIETSKLFANRCLTIRPADIFLI